MDRTTRMRASSSAQVLFTCNDMAVSVHLYDLDTDGCSLPHAGTIGVGQPIALAFLDGVTVPGIVESLTGDVMRVRFDRPVSRALVDYFCEPAARPDVPTWPTRGVMAGGRAARG